MMKKSKSVAPLDITYCSNGDCPFRKCEIHPSALKQLQKTHPGCLVSVADYGATCRDYIGWIVEKEGEPG